MLSCYLVIGSLSSHVFETRTATGSELFSLLTCSHTTTFTLLSIFSPLEMNSIKIWEAIRSKNPNCSLSVAVRVSKTRVLKLPNVDTTRVTIDRFYLWVPKILPKDNLMTKYISEFQKPSK